MCRASSWRQGDAYFSRGCKAPAESCEAACVHEQVAKRIANVRFTLVEILDSEKYLFHNEDVRTVFELSRDIFKGDFGDINVKYQDREIKSELVRVIGKITESVGLMQQESSGEVTNMCTALDQLVENGRIEGRKEGYKNGREDHTKELILDWTKEGYSVSMITKLLKETEDFVRKVQEEAKVLA